MNSSVLRKSLRFPKSGAAVGAIHTYSAETDDLEVQLIDLQGRLLETTQGNKSGGRISLKDIKPGIYIMNLRQAGRILASRKIVRTL